MDFKSLIDSLVRHKMLLASTTAIVFAIGALAIMQLPNIYSSASKIMVERPNTYSMGGPTPSDNLSQRMHAIIASVMSTNNIQKIILENDLVEHGYSEKDLHEATEDFRDDARLEFDNVAVINQYTGKTGMFSQGLTVVYEHVDPETALTVTQELTNNVLKANEGKGQQSAEFRNNFLTSKSEELSGKLTTVEKKIASFKNANALYLPEVHSLAIRRMDELENKAQRANETIAKLRRDASATAADIATSSTDSLLYAADGTRILGADEQLRLLEIEYATKTNKYSKEHPDVIRLAKEIRGMRSHVSSNDTAGMEADLRAARKRLSVTRKSYSNLHPDVKSLQNKIRGLESSLATAKRNNRPRSTSAPTNPAYNRYLVRQQAIRDDIARENRAISTINQDMMDVRSQLERMPLVEQQLMTLERERKNTEISYQEVQSELSNANLSYGMREADLLEKFVLVEPPVKAFTPTSPKKNLLLPVLLILSIACGLLAAIIKYLLQDRIWRSDDVEAILDTPILLVPKFS